MTAAILLTAAIVPGNVPFLQRADPAVRRRDYAEAFARWMAAPLSNPIVFCESSDADVSDFREMAKTRRGGAPVEVLSFYGQDGVEARGKGYGELRIIEHALASSRLLAEDPMVMKVTGRLYVENAAEIVRPLGDARAAVLCDLRQNLAVADSRVFCATAAFLRRYFVPRAEEIDDRSGATFEIVLARALHAAMADGWTWELLPAAPRWVGMSATANAKYEDTALGHLRREGFRRVKRMVLAR